MTHEDRRCLESFDDVFEVRHESRNRESLDGRWIAIERFYLDLEPRIGRSEDLVALGFIPLDPMLPASRRHPETMNQYDSIGTFRWRGHNCLLLRPCWRELRPETCVLKAPEVLRWVLGRPEEGRAKRASADTESRR